MNLPDKYRPRHLSELLGNDDIRQQLERFAAKPYSTAFLFEGPTGVGKTSAIFCLARALGIDPDEGSWGGFYTLASGEHTADAVRATMQSFQYASPTGKTFRMVHASESKQSDAAAQLWLDILEDLPRCCVICFSTNDSSKLNHSNNQRFLDRCERLRFRADGLENVARQLVRRVWHQETDGRLEPPAIELADAQGNTSFRRVLRLLQPHILRAQHMQHTPQSILTRASARLQSSLSAIDCLVDAGDIGELQTAVNEARRLQLIVAEIETLVPTGSEVTATGPPVAAPTPAKAPRQPTLPASPGIGSRIRERREQLRLSASEVDQRAGRARGQCCNFERGHRVPTPETLALFARALECSVEWLRDGTPPVSAPTAPASPTT